MGDQRASLTTHEVQIKQQKYFDDIPFPLALSPDQSKLSITATDACDWVKENASKLQANLLRHGAILFRDFNLKTAEDFDAFVKAFGMSAFPYVGGAAPRTLITGNVFTANEAPPSEPIPFHHEMAQVPNFPKVLFFYCNVAPSSGGQTPLVHSPTAYSRIAERAQAFVDKLEREGVRYIRVLPDEDDPASPIGRSWKSTFQTTDKCKAELCAKEQGTTIEWLPNGCLKTTTKTLPAVRTDERTGKKTWFNSVIAAYLGWEDSRNDRKRAVQFGNGDAMCEEDMETLRVTLEDLAVDIPWQQGDVIMVDNRQALHARRPFTPPRKILACLCTD